MGIAAYFKNIFGDKEIPDASPDIFESEILPTDEQKDHHYWHNRIAKSLKFMFDDPALDCIIIFGGEVTDGGAGTVNISAGAALSKNKDGEVRILEIPSLLGISLPSGWDDGRQIWATGVYDFAYGPGGTRPHFLGSGDFHVDLKDSWIGNTSSDSTVSESDIFVDSDPNSSPDTIVCWGSFTMTGTTFVSLDSGERSPVFEVGAPIKNLSLLGPNRTGDWRVDGELLFGLDVALTRNVANRLDLVGGDSFKIVSGDLLFGDDVILSRTASDLLALASGDDFQIIDGLLRFGVDVALTRNAANRLDLVGGDSFNIVSGSLQHNGTPVAGFLADGTPYFITAFTGYWVDGDDLLFNNPSPSAGDYIDLSSIISNINDLIDVKIRAQSTPKFILDTRDSTVNELLPDVISINSSLEIIAERSGTTGSFTADVYVYYK